MKFNMPMAVFGGLALIAAAIYFGPGSQPVSAAGASDHVQKVVICNKTGGTCADIFNKYGRKIGSSANASYRGNTLGIRAFPVD